METIQIISPHTTDGFSEDSRNHIREVRKDVSVSVKQNFFSNDPGSAFLLDISTHGAAICCRKLFPNKTLLRLNITFDENVNFSFKGEIRHIQKKEMVDAASGKKIYYYQYGVKFEDPSPEFSEYLVGSSLRRKFKVVNNKNFLTNSRYQKWENNIKF